MLSERLKQLMLEAGRKEIQLKNMARYALMNALAEVWLKEAEEGAVDGTVKELVDKPPAPMSMKALLQWIMAKEERGETKRGSKRKRR